jgi:phosphate transport system substrate-binding protein
MAYTRGRCTNFDYCSLADSRRDIEVLVGEDFVCPECGKGLKAPVQSSEGSNILLPLLIGGGVLVLVGGAVFLGMRMGSSGPAVPAPKPVASAPATPGGGAATPPPIAAPQSAESVLVRLAGSESIGGTLAPSLAAAYLAQIGDTDVKTEPGGAPGQVKVAGLRGDRREVILVDSNGAAAAFKELAAGTTDVVMAARRILPAEHDATAALGDLTAPAAEHVVALDGLALVVNPANPVASLRRDQIRGVFSGSVRDWSELGGTPGPITLYAPDPQSEAGALFASLALNGAAVSPAAKKLVDARQLSAAVAADPRGVGVVDLPAILQNHTLAIGDTGSSPVSPTNKVAIASEDYPLTYRLYLYNSPKAQGGIAQKFVEFAVSPGGQAIVMQQGLVSQTMKPVPPPPPATPLDRFKQIVAGAKKLAVDFRFNPNSSDLDLKGSRDIDRVTNYLLSNHYTGANLILVGFADNQGDPAANVGVSKKRADALAAMFAQRGLPPGKVIGFGSDLPLATNDTEEGREKNRRVEVYILP